MLILSGDQLYRMDFQDMIRTHLENKADVTIAALPVAEAEARSCGIMRIQADGQVIDFEEKPKTPEKLNRVRTDPNWLEKLGLQAARPALPGQHGHLPVQSPGLWSTCSSRATRPISATRSCPRPSPTTGCRPTCSTATGRTSGPSGAFHQANIDLTRDDPPFDFTFGEQPDLHPAALPALLADQRRHRQEQPDLRRLHDRPRHR